MFVFDGRLGYLDTALATRSIANWVKRLTIFYINADEPDILDHDMTFKTAEQDASYEPFPYRVSDHDPVIVGISFGDGRARPLSPASSVDCSRTTTRIRGYF